MGGSRGHEARPPPPPQPSPVKGEGAKSLFSKDLPLEREGAKMWVKISPEGEGTAPVKRMLFVLFRPQGLQDTTGRHRQLIEPHAKGAINGIREGGHGRHD